MFFIKNTSHKSSRFLLNFFFDKKIFFPNELVGQSFPLLHSDSKKERNYFHLNVIHNGINEPCIFYISFLFCVLMIKFSCTCVISMKSYHKFVDLPHRDGHKEEISSALQRIGFPYKSLFRVYSESEGQEGREKVGKGRFGWHVAFVVCVTI